MIFRTLAALGLMSSSAMADDADTNVVCDNEPVIMVVTGLTHDRDTMLAYGKKIAESGLYPRLAGYYLIVPQPVAVFEGDVATNFVNMLVRFPCLAHAKAFWYSDIYQNEIKPMRTDVNAGTYSVTVHKEIDLPPYMAGRVGSADYVPMTGPEISPVQ